MGESAVNTEISFELHFDKHYSTIFGFPNVSKDFKKPTLNGAFFQKFRGSVGGHEPQIFLGAATVRLLLVCCKFELELYDLS